MEPAGVRRFLILLGILAIWACGDGSGCPSCVEDVDPGRIVDPRSLGDGSGYPGDVWDRVSEPSVLGWSPGRLNQVRDLASGAGSDALMVVDRGIVVLEFGSTEKTGFVQSCRKSFLSALVGIFVHSGTIDLGLTLEEMGIDDLPPSLTQEEKQATIEDLIMARSGVYHEAAAESQSMKNARPERGSHSPGTYWYYNNWDFNALGTIFIQLTGEDIFQAIYDYFAVPLQMQEYQPSNGSYYFEDVSEHPAYHFGMSARDMARFGLLFLEGGRWRDQQIVPEAWVQRSTQPYSATGGLLDYGYLWWVGAPGDWEGHRLFAALGGSGQAIFVIPDLEVVITHRVDYETWQGDWDTVYELVKTVIKAKVY